MKYGENNQFQLQNTVCLYVLELWSDMLPRLA